MTASRNLAAGTLRPAQRLRPPQRLRGRQAERSTTRVCPPTCDEAEVNRSSAPDRHRRAPEDWVDACAELCEHPDLQLGTVDPGSDTADRFGLATAKVGQERQSCLP